MGTVTLGLPSTELESELKELYEMQQVAELASQAITRTVRTLKKAISPGQKLSTENYEFDGKRCVLKRRRRK